MNILESMGMERCKWKRSCVVRMGSRIITRVLLNCLLWGISKLFSKKIFVEVSSPNLKLNLHLMTKTLCPGVENSEFRLVPSSGIHFTQLVDRINIPVTFHISYFLHNVQYDVKPTPIQRLLQSYVQFHEEEYASTTCLCYQEHTVLFFKIHSYCQRVKIF